MEKGVMEHNAFAGVDTGGMTLPCGVMVKRADPGAPCTDLRVAVSRTKTPLTGDTPRLLQTVPGAISIRKISCEPTVA